MAPLFLPPIGADPQLPNLCEHGVLLILVPDAQITFHPCAKLVLILFIEIPDGIGHGHTLRQGIVTEPADERSTTTSAAAAATSA